MLRADEVHCVRPRCNPTLAYRTTYSQYHVLGNDSNSLLWTPLARIDLLPNQSKIDIFLVSTTAVQTVLKIAL